MCSWTLGMAEDGGVGVRGEGGSLGIESVLTATEGPDLPGVDI